jgi:hypothetical protein
MKKNRYLAETSIVADAYPGIAICRRGELREIIVPSVGDITFNPSRHGRTLFLGSSEGAFRIFVDEWSEVRLEARHYIAGPTFAYVVSVTGKEA